MSIELELVSDCDAPGCRNRIKIGESCYCHSCYVALLNDMGARENEIDELKTKLKEAGLYR